MKLPFELTVYVYKRPNLRSYSVEMEAFMGLNVLRDMYDDMKVNDVDSLYLSFPERWLNILELRQLPDRLVKYCPNLKTVTIKTHSVYLVQCVRSEHIKIIQHDERDVDHSALDVKLYLDNPRSLDLFNGSGLTVL